MTCKRLLSGVGRLASAAVGLSIGASSAAAAPPDTIFSLCLAGADAVTADRIWAAWSLAPETTIPLALLAALSVASWRRAGAGTVSGAQAAVFAAGYGLLLIALVSPLCRLAATLASAHMVQHVILVALAPPLLVLGAGAHRHPRLLRAAVPLWLSGSLYGVAIWAWHLPAFYQAALLGTAAHLALYASLLATSALFWHGVLRSVHAPAERTAAAVLALLTALMHTGLLGALLTFSPQPWYPLMSTGALTWGFAPLADQQLAGLIMWVPMGAVYLIAALALAGHRLGNLDAFRAPTPAARR